MEELKKIEEQEKERISAAREEALREEEKEKAENEKLRQATKAQAKHSELNEQRKKLLKDISAANSESKKEQLQDSLQKIEEELRKKVEEDFIEARQ